MTRTHTQPQRATHQHTRGLRLLVCLRLSLYLPLSVRVCVRVSGSGGRSPREERARLTDDGSGTHTVRTTDGRLATCLTPALDAAIAMASASTSTDATTRRQIPKFVDRFRGDQKNFANGHRRVAKRYIIIEKEGERPPAKI